MYNFKVIWVLKSASWTTTKISVDSKTVETRIFWETLSTPKLLTNLWCREPGSRISSAMVLIMLDKRVPVFHVEGFQRSEPLYTKNTLSYWYRDSHYKSETVVGRSIPIPLKGIFFVNKDPVVSKLCEMSENADILSGARQGLIKTAGDSSGFWYFA